MLNQESRVDQEKVRRGGFGLGVRRDAARDADFGHAGEGDLYNLEYGDRGASRDDNPLCASRCDPAGGMRRLSGHPLASVLGAALFRRRGMQELRPAREMAGEQQQQREDCQ